ncbi:NAD(P)/FAD-dependent oxidoreductase [Radiobacillus sp. PE A8.2]|uniref:NAD(P)/FAD-dependent oxidoreductase n=1 Tax=Radiobacillus sp. PE A8.2 TaxID=3380349 RepID=UPI00388F32C1
MIEKMTHYDGIIVGAGITGCSIAYFLAEKGCTNLLVIDKGGIASDITGICPGGVRQQWGTEINCRMSKFSVDFFERINEHLQPEKEIKFRSVGYLNLLHSEEAIENYKNNIKLQNSFGIPTTLISPEEVEKIVPGINTDRFLQAAFCETDGFVDDVYHVTSSFAEAAKRKGVTFVNSEVIRITDENGVVTGIDMKEEGFISANFVVNAAGLGSKQLAATIGVELPIEFENRRILYSNRMEQRLIEPLIISSETGFAGKQLASGIAYSSYLGGELKAPYSMYEFKDKVIEVGKEIFPPIEKLEFRTHVDGTYDSTPDHQAILGDVDSKQGYYQAVGMSGHGFMMSPAVGQAMADIILSLPTTIDVSSLHFNRFSKNELLFEPSVV